MCESDNVDERAFNEKVNDALIAAKNPLVMYVTGGGSEAISDLLRHGGASSYLMEGLVHYCPQSTHELLGYVPKHYACEETARALALRAYERCLKLTNNSPHAIGLAATSKLYKPGEREGREHEIHVVLQCKDSTTAYSIKPNIQYREIEEYQNKELILMALYHHITGCFVERVQKCMFSRIQYPRLSQRGLQAFDFHMLKDAWDVEPIIFPGSFNPIHKKHIEIAEVIYRRMGKRPWLELSIHNTDKPTMDAIDLHNRIEGIEATHSDAIRGVIITNKPLFVDKAKQYTRPTFVVGSDTINRVFDPQYYFDAAQFLERKNLKFMVFQRKGCLLRPEVLNNPNIEVIPNTEYEDDGTSSTMIRNKE